jgi:UDP-2,3-diacylglucosamine pyrophosphatase LpxH
MNKRFRLKKHEAIALGFEVKDAYSKGNSKYQLNESQVVSLELIRKQYDTSFIEVKRTLDKKGHVISKIEKLAPNALIAIPENHEIKRVSTNVSTKQQWVITEPVKESLIDEDNFLDIKYILENELQKVYDGKFIHTDSNEVDNLIIADLHVGSYIDGLVKTKDYSIPILIQYLEKTAITVNRNNSKEVNVLCLGDLIESFTGLNHKNSWKGLQKGMIGAEVIKFTAKILHEKLLSKINNLNKVKIVAGNHDRLTSDKSEDVDGGAADLIAYSLELMGYNVEFHPTVISTEIDGINYIMLHGHKGISSKSTKDICWDYGVQGMFNVVLEGHLHSLIQKLSLSQRKAFKTLKDDCTDTLRMNCRSFFTGNGFSEDLGYTSNAGFTIIRNNGNGLPDIDNKML